MHTLLGFYIGEGFFGEVLGHRPVVLHLSHLLYGVVAGGVCEVVVDDGLHPAVGVFGGDDGVDNGIVVPNARLKRYGLVLVRVAVFGDWGDEIVDGALLLSEVHSGFDRLWLGRGVNPYHTL